ncbi:DUF2630 family protein [uncultured Nocardioides sp.]|uniref:DUF2630 family protein n=1 Tax=uncultured Nocardioides sp. TaxID=198441 RepID=UPI0025CEC96C|nr:DUF2630 family protein [uncultured Nocardioides sp.]
MNQHEILGRVQTLVDREHELREKRQSGELSREEEQAEMRHVEEALDQCWDLLRQRRAKREFDRDPDEATVRSVGEVEGYLQ